MSVCGLIAQDQFQGAILEAGRFCWNYQKFFRLGRFGLPHVGIRRNIRGLTAPTLLSPCSLGFPKVHWLWGQMN